MLSFQAISVGLQPSLHSQSPQTFPEVLVRTKIFLPHHRVHMLRNKRWGSYACVQVKRTTIDCNLGIASLVFKSNCLQTCTLKWQGWRFEGVHFQRKFSNGRVFRLKRLTENKTLKAHWHLKINANDPNFHRIKRIIIHHYSPFLIG